LPTVGSNGVQHAGHAASGRSTLTYRACGRSYRSVPCLHCRCGVTRTASDRHRLRKRWEGSWVDAKSPMHSLTTAHDKRFAAGAAICAGRHSRSSSIAGRKAGHGDDRVWKAWKVMMPASHASRIAEECPYRASGEALQDLGGSPPLSLTVRIREAQLEIREREAKRFVRRPRKHRTGYAKRPVRIRVKCLSRQPLR
jgi:hypothetical protein